MNRSSTKATGKHTKTRIFFYIFLFSCLPLRSKRGISEDRGDDNVATRIVEFLRIERVDRIFKDLLVETIYVHVP